MYDIHIIHIHISQTFTEEEMNKFEEDYEDYYDYEYDEEGNIIGFKTKSRDQSKSTDERPAVNEPPGMLYSHSTIVCT